MSDRLGVEPAPKAFRPAWSWFLPHGVLAIAFGLFTLATPFTDASGFLLDGYAFAALCLVAGAQTIPLARQARPFDRHWIVLLAIGLHAMGAAIAFCLLSALQLPYGLFWSIVSFLMLQGVVLAVGLLRSAMFRMWGLLTGSCMFAGAVILMVTWLADPEHSFDIPDAGMGIAGVMYGIAVFVAALQARGAYYRQGQVRRV